MRRLVAILLVVAMLTLSVPPAAVHAATEPQVSDLVVQVDGIPLEAPVLSQAGRTLVPFRAVGDALGASVGWDPSTQTASLTLQDRVVLLQIGSSVARVREGDVTREVALEAPALLYQSRTYVPARVVAEGLGYSVNYDAVNRMVVIASPAGGGGGSLPNTIWLRYDVTGDRRVDGDDVQRLWTGGAWTASHDVNGDGKKNALDMWDLLLRITQWDRTADRAVAADDFGSHASISLPAPDADAADALVRAMLAEVEDQVPSSTEIQLRQEWAAQGPVSPAQLGSLWEQAGTASLLLGNLEVAQWAFAKSYIASPERDSALANLGFILAQTDRFEEAMLLNARAREMNPQACATNSNIGWVFARHDQLNQATDYYRQAVNECPNLSQYHLNLGAVLLRAGSRGEAQREFEKAAVLSAHDPEALIMAVASNPMSPQSLAEYGGAYDRQQQEWFDQMVEEGAASPEERQESITPWENLNAGDRWQAIRQQIGAAVQAELEGQLKALADETSAELHQLAKAALPQGKSACEDLTRWNANWQDTAEAMVRTVQAANMRADGLATAAERKAAAMELSMGNLLLEMVVAEAQALMVEYDDAASAHEAFDRHVFEVYDQLMAEAEQQMRTATISGGQLDIPDKDELFFGVIMGGMMLPMGNLVEGYSESLDRCGVQPKPSPEWQMSDPGASFTIGVAIVQVEYKPESGEVKLQVGQGVLVAGTWSPKSGFGVQGGVGFDVGVGPVKAGGATWVKRGSDGSLTLEVEGGGGLGGKWTGGSEIGGSWQYGQSLELRAASNEPIGAL